MSRVQAYWTLLAKGERQKAVLYVEPSCREIFQDRVTPVFFDPRVSALGLAANKNEVSVTVEVRRVFPQFPAPVTWPVTEKWIFSKGSWFVMLEKAAAPFPSAPGKPRPASLSPEEVEKRQKAIREALRFESLTLQFGTVRQGSTASMILKYQLSGEQALPVVFRGAPGDLIILGPTDRRFAPGKEQSIQLDLVTENYDGEVNIGFSAVIRSQEVEVPYDFEIHGFVHTPVSAVPMELKFKKGEREQEFVLRNNTKSEININGLYSQSSGFEVKDLPATLPPGVDCRFKVTVLLNTAGKNFRDFLALSLEKPVEGMQTKFVPVVLNYEEVKTKGLLELTPQEIEELLRKSNPIKK